MLLWVVVRYALLPAVPVPVPVLSLPRLPSCAAVPAILTVESLSVAARAHTDHHMQAMARCAASACCHGWDGGMGPQQSRRAEPRSRQGEASAFVSQQIRIVPVCRAPARPALALAPDTDMDPHRRPS